MLHRLFIFLALFLMASNGANGQVIHWDRIAHWDDPIPVRPTGGLPSLQQAKVAFDGLDTTGHQGIWSAPVDGSTDPFELVNTLDLVPNSPQPDQTFIRFASPSIEQGIVYFTGSYTHSFFSGIYSIPANGGPLTTVLDASTTLQKPAWPSAGPHGISFRVDPSFGTPPAFLPAAGDPFTLAVPQTPAPGGGNFQLFDRPESPSYGGQSVVFSAHVGGQSTGAIGGVYEYSIPSGELLLVANGNTPFPGEPVNFHTMISADVDEEQIVFVGQGPGFIGFGAVSGVFSAGVGANGKGNLRTIARSGDPAPEGGTFNSFDHVSVDNDLVLFVGITGHPAVGTPAGLYGSYRGGAPFAILKTGDFLDGNEIVGIGLSAHGQDQHQIALSLQYSTGSTMFYPPSLYVASIDLSGNTPSFSRYRPNLLFGNPERKATRMIRNSR